MADLSVLLDFVFDDSDDDFDLVTVCWGGEESV